MESVGVSTNKVTWDDDFVEEIKRTVSACKVQRYNLFHLCGIDVQDGRRFSDADRGFMILYTKLFLPFLPIFQLADGGLDAVL